MRPQGVALPIINLAIWLERDDDAFSQIRIAVGPGGPTPWSGTEAEKALLGKSLNDESFNAALEALLAQVGFRSSARRASSRLSPAYRQWFVQRCARNRLGEERANH